MPSPSVDVSSAITIVFATSGFSAEVLDVDWGGISRDAIDVTHQASPADAAGSFGRREFLPKDFSDPGELTFGIHFNPDTEVPIDAAPEVVTVTWPSGATWAGTGFITSYEPSAPLDDKMTGNITVKFSGQVTVTAAV